MKRKRGWVLALAFAAASCDASEPAAPPTHVQHTPIARSPMPASSGPVVEGDIQIVTTVDGAVITGQRWAGKTVPYAIDPTFAHPERVTGAIAHWQEHTAIKLVPRTTESDYVVFSPGHGCSSSIGRVGGAQAITLVSGEHISALAAADFDRADDHAHFWWRDGYRTVGRSSDVDAREVTTAYALSPGYTPDNLADAAFANDGSVYAFYRDGNFSIGSPSDLGALHAPQPYALPAGYAPRHVVGVAFSPDGHLHAWYVNGATSEGTPSDLASIAAPIAFVAASGKAAGDILAIGIASGGTTYAWYASGQASGGTTTSLGATYAPYDVSTPGHCGVPEVIHEIGHAVGFYHEQTRYDRDQYITIMWSEIEDGEAYNFETRGAGTDVGPYDYDSIMHYDSWAFAKATAPTMLRKNGATIDRSSVLSAGDLAAVAFMYP